MTTQIAVETLTTITHKHMPVVTTELLAALYGTEPARIRNNFQRNKDRFSEGKHYYKLTGSELNEFKHKVSLRDSVDIAKNVRALTLWTERGAARHAKMLETDQAWDVFEKLEDCYFNQRQGDTPTTTYSRTPLRDAVNLLVGKKGMMYPDAYSLIHHRFGVNRIEQLNQSQMLDAIEYIHCLLLNDDQQKTVPLNGRLLLNFRDGEMVGHEMLSSNTHVATIDAFMEIAQRAGYLLIHEDDAAPLIQAFASRKEKTRNPVKRLTFDF